MTASLTTQIELAKTKINALSATTLTTQDIVFLAKSLESLGTLLGVNDIVAVTNTKISEITNASSGQVQTITNAGSSQVNAVVTSGSQQIALVNAAVDNYNLFVNMGVI
jgi:hypothetical protein